MRRRPRKKPFSTRLSARLAGFIDNVAAEDPRFYNRSHVIEEALVSFARRYTTNPGDITLVEDASKTESVDDF